MPFRWLRLALLYLTSASFLVIQQAFLSVILVRAQTSTPISEAGGTDYVCNCIDDETGKVVPEAGVIVALSGHCWRGNERVGIAKCKPRTTKETPKCAAILTATQNKIKNGGNVTIDLMHKNNISEIYEDYPHKRPYGYYIFLKGPATDSILKSTKLLATISTDIIKNCESVSMIAVGKSQSDYHDIWGLKEDGKIEIFTECVKPPVYTKLRWGQTYCYY